ncbi:MAG: 5'-deoxynucleotidase [Clostridiales bacterium]|nr:5'-deoxynucleotidase [Clostridiales bacterium]
MDNKYGFYALLDRMQYINRWALMRNSRYENIKEHSFDVAVIAESLAVIHNKLVSEGKAQIKVDPFEIQAYGLYHDCTEIITGDMPTPIKYRNDTLKAAYREVEHEAAESLSSQLPDYMQEYYMNLLAPDFSGEEGALKKRLVKSADRIAAYIKCIREKLAGNTEFDSAMATIKESIDKIDLPEVSIFMENFTPSFGLTLDQLNT